MGLGSVRYPVVLAIVAVASAAAAEPVTVSEAPSSVDRIESVQSRAWAKKGAGALSATAAYGLNDPFLARGGGGLRATYWPRSLLGLTLEVSGWAQTPSASARIAQRELRARMRSAGSSWVALVGAEMSAADGKLALGETIVPFELMLRLGGGAASSGTDLDSAPALALGAGVGFRWFLSGVVGLETTLSWRTASVVRQLDGQGASARDTVVAFELGLPFRLGGGK